MNRTTACKILDTYQKWSRGIGEFAWNKDPIKNKPLPYAPREVGEAIDVAITALKVKAAKRKLWKTAGRKGGERGVARTLVATPCTVGELATSLIDYIDKDGGLASEVRVCLHKPKGVYTIEIANDED